MSDSCFIPCRCSPPYFELHYASARGFHNLNFVYFNDEILLPPDQQNLFSSDQQIKESMYHLIKEERFRLCNSQRRVGVS